MKSTSSRNVNAHYLRLVSVLYMESSFCYENIWPRKKPVTWICSFLFKKDEFEETYSAWETSSDRRTKVPTIIVTLTNDEWGTWNFLVSSWNMGGTWTLMSQSLGEVPLRGPSTEWSGTEKDHCKNGKAARTSFRLFTKYCALSPGARLDPEATGTGR